MSDAADERAVTATDPADRLVRHALNTLSNAAGFVLRLAVDDPGGPRR